MTFDPAKIIISCPADGASLQAIGGSDFYLRCPQCGLQFRPDPRALGGLAVMGSMPTIPFVGAPNWNP